MTLPATFSSAHSGRRWRSAVSGLAVLAGMVLVLLWPAAYVTWHRPATPDLGAETTGGALNERDIADVLDRAGFRQVSDIRRRGPNFTATARLGERRMVRLVISGDSGAVLGLKVVSERPLDAHGG